MRSATFITARLESERLPRKILAEVEGRTVLARLVDWLGRAERPEFIVLCTTEESADDALAGAAAELGARVFRGSRDDILGRWLGAAEANEVDFMVACDGDDLFCDFVHVDRVIEAHEATGADYVTCKSLPLGAAPTGIAVPALRRVCELKTETNTEGQGRFFQDPRVVTRTELEAPPELRLDEARMTLDYPEDLEFFRAVIRELEPQNPAFGLVDVVDLLRRRPDIMQINSGRNAEYWERFNARYPPVELQG